MENSTLFQTLQLLTEKELHTLESFLENSFFDSGTHHRQNLELFRYLKEQLLAKKPPVVEKAEVLAQLYGSEKGSSRYLENRMSELLALVRKFIAWSQVDSSTYEVLELMAMSRFMLQRGSTKLQELTVGKIRKTLELQSGFIAENPVLGYFLQDELFRFENLSNQRKGDLNIPATIESLSVFYATQLLEIALAQYQQARLAPDFEPVWQDLVAEMRSVFSKYRHFENPTLILLEAALQLMTNPEKRSKASIEEYIDLLDQHEEAIPLPILKNLAGYARSYCNKCINQGYLDLKALRLNLYKTHLEKGWLFEAGKLIPGTFINMINVGLWEGEREWVWYVLTNFKSRIAGQNRRQVIYYASALYHADAREYNQANEYLRQLFQEKKFGDLDFSRFARVLEVKILYEEGQFELLETQIQNFRMFLSRRKTDFGEELTALYNRFLTCLHKLAQLNSERRLKLLSKDAFFEKLLHFENELNLPLPPIADKPWLQKKLEELKEGLWEK